MSAIRFLANAPSLSLGDSLEACRIWPAPTVIISDGPYGLGKFPGETTDVEALPDIYGPFAEAWARQSGPDATLWFWCTEIGWAVTHSVLKAAGWEFRKAVTWNKGMANAAGRCNSQTIRSVPCVTELAAHYVKKPEFRFGGGSPRPIKEWIRAEWMRSGLPFRMANGAAGVKDVATRMWLSEGPLWFLPPPHAAVALSRFCAAKGRPTDVPYFSLDGANPPTEEAWSRLRPKWNHIHGHSNVWDEPAVAGPERIKGPSGVAHANQKPLRLMERQILMSSDPGDVVWEPFGGLCSASVAALRTGRRAFAAESNPDYFGIASERLDAEFAAASPWKAAA